MRDHRVVKVAFCVAVVAVAAAVVYAARVAYPDEPRIVTLIPALVVAQLGWWLQRRIWPTRSS